jgi:phage I-like protein
MADVSVRPEAYGAAEKERIVNDSPRLCILVGALTERNGLRRIPVAVVTRGYKGKQHYTVTADDLAAIVRNFRKKTVDVPVDYEHSTLYAAGEPVPTAAWLREIDDQPDANGVLWGWCDYTKSGAASVAARDYKYVSPVIEWTKRDKKTGELQGATVTSLALTKQPLFESLPELPLVASNTEGWSFERSDAPKDQIADDLEAAICALVEKKIEDSGHKLDYLAAFKQVIAENSDLVHRMEMARREASVQTQRVRAFAQERDACVDQMIHPLVLEKIAASEGGRIDYGQAYKSVLNERPDLRRKKAEAMRLC